MLQKSKLRLAFAWLLFEIFSADVQYANNARYVAALLSDRVHLIVMAPNRERDLTYEMAFTATLPRYLFEEL